MATYCGSIGSVNVLEFMSSDLFDESQENPVLLQQHGAGSPMLSPQSNGALPARKSVIVKAVNLPLEDDCVEQQLLRSPEALTPRVKVPNAPVKSFPMLSPTRASVSFAANGGMPLRSILKRQSSYDSGISTMGSETEQDYYEDYDGAAADPNEHELHKLMYSLKRFGMASEDQVHASPRKPSMKPSELDSPTSRRRSRAQSSALTEDSEFDMYPPPEALNAIRSRPSVTFATVKNLLRGGGGLSRTVQRTIPNQRRKTMGTLSSRLKRRQKFQRPTILTDAYHRVSTMKLGTKPMPTVVKHVAFPYTWQESDGAEADPGMPSPKGMLRRDSQIMLETLDKIGTRAACPVHLIHEDAPDYSNVRARVDSYMPMSPKRGVRRPSAWLTAP